MKVFINELVFDKVMHWINKTTDEVSGFGKVVRTDDGFEVVDVYLLEQECGGAHTDIDGTSLAKLMYRTRDDEGDLRWWWHSHVNMGVFWSSTDKDTIIDLGKNGWIIATVFNKKEEMRSALAYKTQSELGEHTQFIDQLATVILTPTYDDETLAAWDKEFTDNVKKKSYVYTPPSHGNHHRSYPADPKVVGPMHGQQGTLITMPTTGTTEIEGHMSEDFRRTWDRQDDLSPTQRSMLASAKIDAMLNGESNELDDDDPDMYYFRHGLYGHGLKEEAAVCKMSVKQYYNLISGASMYSPELQDIELILDQAEKDGVLRY